MEKVFKFTIDQVPPSTNHLYTNGSHGRRVLVQEGRKYKKHILSTCKKAVDGYAFVDKSHWEAEITYYLSSSFNLRDVNNMDKLIVDGVAKAIGVDDRYMQGLNLRKFQCASGDERVEVTLLASVADF